MTRLLVIMDPIEVINTVKDTTFAFLLEAGRRGWAIFYSTVHDIFMHEQRVKAKTKALHDLHDRPVDFFRYGDGATIALNAFDVVLMRKDPPFDRQFLHVTHLLDLAESQGARVINKPQALRDANEKLFAAWFPDCCPQTLVTANMALLQDFLDEHSDIVCKPLDAMGGESIFRLKKGDVNAKVIFETLTKHGDEFIMAQRFIPEVIESGDKRVLLLHGKPVPYTLARVPMKGEFRGNLAVGGQGVPERITKKELQIAEFVGPRLAEKGLLFVGLDIIGGYLTEINVTSPTCVRQIDAAFDLNVCGEFFDGLA